MKGIIRDSYNERQRGNGGYLFCYTTSFEGIGITAKRCWTLYKLLKDRLSGLPDEPARFSEYPKNINSHFYDFYSTYNPLYKQQAV
jgi:hypothetical protein